VERLAVKDVAERTGIAPATLRVWELRYGFPTPQRTPSGYRQYSEDDVATLRRVLAFRRLGLSVPAAVQRARSHGEPTDRPSIFGAIVTGDAPVQPRRLHKSTLLALSRAIEDETLARAAGPIVVGAFQQERNYRGVEHRYRRLAGVADAAVVFADFAGACEPEGGPVEIPITQEDALGNEWAVVIDAPGFAACLLAWEDPDTQRIPDLPEARRRFEALWTLDPRVVRRAAEVGSALAARAAPAVSERLADLLADRPLASEEPTPALTALTNRIIAYLDAVPPREGPGAVREGSGRPRHPSP
jgi:DICT domain-containing protein